MRIIVQKRHKRTPVKLKAELISGDKNYEGSIMNISDDGIYIVTSPTRTSIDFIPGNPLNVRFQTHSGESLDLNCEVEWLHIDKTLSNGLTNKMGIEIIDTPQEYRDFFIFKTLE